jgi:F-type H+-transporting ATPase subunit epsilon
MPTTHLNIITAERIVLSEDVDIVVAPGTMGELGVLPRHAPLLTGLMPGELRYRKGGEEVSLAITGGFMEVLPHRVTVLADAAERADEIDMARAEAARQRALSRMADRSAAVDMERAKAALMRATVRLKVAHRRRRGQSQP